VTGYVVDATGSFNAAVAVAVSRTGSADRSTTVSTLSAGHGLLIFRAASRAGGRAPREGKCWRFYAMGSTNSSLNAQTSASHLSGENPAAARSKSVVKAHI
jgi:hypothetical protein